MDTYEIAKRIAEHVKLKDESKTWVYHRGWLFLWPFICMGCAKPVSGRQYAFSRSCGACDVSNSKTRKLHSLKCFAGVRILIDDKDSAFIPESHFVPPENADQYHVLYREPNKPAKEPVSLLRRSR